MLLQIADNDGVAENTFKDTGAVVLLLLLLLKKDAQNNSVDQHMQKNILWYTIIISWI